MSKTFGIHRRVCLAVLSLSMGMLMTPVFGQGPWVSPAGYYDSFARGASGRVHPLPPVWDEGYSAEDSSRSGPVGGGGYPGEPSSVTGGPAFVAPARPHRREPLYLARSASAAEEEAASSPTAGDAATGAETQSPSQPIGEKPPEDINRSLLRSTTVLLKPGQFQTELGIAYTWQEADAVAVLPGGVPVLERIRQRRLLMPLSLRYGWTKSMELFGTVPFGIGLFERDNPLTERSDQTGVLGDVTFGFIRQLPVDTGKWPDTTLNFSVTAPTGTSAMRSPEGNVAALGNGFWQFGSLLNFVRSYDPFVLYGGVGYQVSLPDEFHGIEVFRGHGPSYYFGFGFAGSDDISLSATLAGAWRCRTVINGVAVPNSDEEPVSLRLALLRRTSLKRRVQPFVQFGLNDDAADYYFGVLLIHDFH